VRTTRVSPVGIPRDIYRICFYILVGYFHNCTTMQGLMNVQFYLNLSICATVLKYDSSLHVVSFKHHRVFTK